MRMHRMFTLTLSIVFGLSVLVFRLAYIQMIGTESFSKRNVNLIQNAVKQRQQTIVLSSGRGEITDRYGISLTGNQKYVLVGFPFVQRSIERERNLYQVAEILHLSVDKLKEFILSLKKPTIFPSQNESLALSEEQMKRVNALDIPGLIAVPMEERYAPEKRYAQHLIGYVGQNSEYVRANYANEIERGILTPNSEIGISGLEKTFQPFLQSSAPSLLSYTVDARGEPIPGLSFKYIDQISPFYPLVVQSTLDLELQTVVERVMDQRQIREGAIVVLDIETSELLALSSRPDYMQNKEDVHSWENKALTRYSPGSIFKLVIAAAALEEELVNINDSFICNGQVEGTTFNCWKRSGHGKLTFEEAFAHSCNVVFGLVAQQLGPDVIEAYAHKLGFLQPNGWEGRLFRYSHFRQFDHEETGQVFSAERTEQERTDKQYLLQTGIGQLDVQVTPLAVANMIATITKGGIKHQVKAVNNILYQTGAIFYHFGEQTLSGPKLSPYTAYQLQKLMANVVIDGTGQALAAEPWHVGGKTGTAQRFDPVNGTERNHQWFAGYYPQQNPRYAIVVLALHRSPREKNVAIEGFRDIVQWLAKQP